MDAAATVAVLRAEVSGAAAVIDAHLAFMEGDLLLHVLLGELADFYVSRLAGDAERERRFWDVVERIARVGDEHVVEALHVSLVEWFAWGHEHERGALVAHATRERPLVRAMAAHYLDLATGRLR